ncbi:MAG: hypothetical protein HQ592_14150 [Planctomycetes bacterium]|nr:hypothetical protein [Planctomycetota bacterium]
MKTDRKPCRHHNAKIFGVQKLGNLPGIVLYNCPDCRTTVSEERLFSLRNADDIQAKLAVA